MADVNAFTFTGRLGQDAKVKTLPSGKVLMECSVANNTGYGDYKKTNWLKVKMWGDRVKNIAQIFVKGALVGGVGRVTTESWEGRDGETHTDMVVDVQDFQLLAGTGKQYAMNPVEPEHSEEDVVF